MAAFLTICQGRKKEGEKSEGEINEEVWGWIERWGEEGLTDDDIFWWSKRVEPREMEMRLGEMIVKERELEEEKKIRKAVENRLAEVMEEKRKLNEEALEKDVERGRIEGRVREVIVQMREGEKERSQLAKRVEELEYFLSCMESERAKSEGGDFSRTPPLLPLLGPPIPLENRLKL